MNDATRPGSSPANSYAVKVDDTTPRITLADLEFPIPILAFRQNRVIEPLLLKIMPTYHRMLMTTQTQLEAAKKAVDGLGADVSADDQANAAAKASSEAFLSGALDLEIDDQTVDQMATIVYTAITRATPGFARAEMDGMPFGTDQLIAALGVVIQQTGMFRRASPGQKKAVTPGEGQAGEQTSTS